MLTPLQSFRPAFVLIAMLLTAGCGQRIGQADGGVDAGADAGVDAGTDAGNDGGEADPAETELTAGPEGTVNTAAATFEFTGTPAGVTFQCSLDDAAFSTCVSPVILSGLTDGDHTFAVRAVSAAGPDASPATRTWTVSTQIPQTTLLTTSPASPTTSTDAAFSFESNRASATFECQLDAEPYAACTSPKTYSSVTEGTHTFRVRAVDTGGTDPSSATYTWTVDLTAPETTLQAKPGATHFSTTAEFAFISSEANSTFECTFDGATEACTSPKSYSELADGSHTFSVVAIDQVARRDATPASWTFSVDSSPVTIRIMAANTSSGSGQSYLAEGTRIFQGLDPDIVLIQEFTVDSSLGSLDTWVDNTFGTDFVWFREPIGSGESIPNGVISRYPIIAAGEWTQPTSPGAGETRDFVWARIDIPGDKDLWVVSLHLATTDGDRPNEANVLVAQIQASIPAADYLVVGGDLNTDSRTETAMNTLGTVVVNASPYPVDQNGNGNTNANRNSPYDWVLADSDLDPLEVPVVIGGSTYNNGLVFDSRVYTPLTEVSPVQQGDSGVSGMQHMAVVRDFLITP